MRRLDAAILIFVLARAQVTDRVGGEAACGPRQGIEHQQREIGAHGFVEHDGWRGAVNACRGKQVLQRRAGAIGIRPWKERQVGVLA
ncbi:hypothetical protein D9M68_899720 [compost metagenome]